MPEQTPRTFNHFSLFRYTPKYFQLETSDRREINKIILEGLRVSADCIQVYQAFPALAEGDILAWSSLAADKKDAASAFFQEFARVFNRYRSYLEPVTALWGFTKPSQYTRTRSTQEIDPFSLERMPYLIMYPFVKTPEWYLMSREARQGMMNEHIRIGKQYPDITQLLLYSFGLQDQEFIVVYETDDLTRFSDLVYELRDSEARKYTERDTPLITAVYHPAEETLALFE